MLVFDAPSHTYTLDGARVPSVTELLRTVGLVRFDHVPPSILAAAQQRGTTVHQAIHYYNEHDLDITSFAEAYPELLGYLDSWRAVLASGRFRTVLCEHRVASAHPAYAGTIDWLGVIDGVPSLLDFATGRPEDAAKHLQTAAYVMAARSWAQQPEEAALRDFFAVAPFVERYSVRLDAGGGWPTLTPYRDARDYRDFRLIAETVNLVAAHARTVVPWHWRDGVPA